MITLLDSLDCRDKLVWYSLHCVTTVFIVLLECFDCGDKLWSHWCHCVTNIFIMFLECFDCGQVEVSSGVLTSCINKSYAFLHCVLQGPFRTRVCPRLGGLRQSLPIPASQPSFTSYKQIIIFIAQYRRLSSKSYTKRAHVFFRPIFSKVLTCSSYSYPFEIPAKALCLNWNVTQQSRQQTV